MLTTSTLINIKEVYLKSFVFNELFKSVYNVKMSFLIIISCVTTVEPSISGYTLSCSFCVIQITYQCNKTDINNLQIIKSGNQSSEG